MKTKVNLNPSAAKNHTTCFPFIWISLLLALSFPYVPLRAEDKEPPTPFEIGMAKGALSRLSPEAGKFIAALDAAAAAKDKAQMQMAARSLQALGLPAKDINTLVSAALLSKGVDAKLEEWGFAFGQGSVDFLNWLTEPGPLVKSEYAKIQTMKIEHNVVSNGEAGMLIHLDCTIYRHLNKECRVAAYFYSSDGSPMKDRDGLYKSDDGQVSTGEDFTPSYESSHYKDLTVFIPNSQLHLPAGKGTFEVQVGLYCKQGRHWLCEDVKSSLSFGN